MVDAYIYRYKPLDNCSLVDRPIVVLKEVSKGPFHRLS